MGEELLFTEKRTIIEREATYNTDQIAIEVAASNPLRYEAFEQVDVVANVDPRPRAILRPAFGSNRAQVIPKNLSWTMGGIVPLPSTPGNAPLGMDNLMVGAGMSENVVLNTTATYSLETLAQAGLTIYHWMRQADEDTYRFIYGTGCRGNFSINGSTRDWVRFASTLESANFPLDTTQTAGNRGWTLDLAWFNTTTGVLLLDRNGDALVGYVPAETTDDPLGLLLRPQSTITIDGVCFPVSAFSLDHGVNIKTKEVTCSAVGVPGGVFLTGRGITGDFTLAEGGTAFEKALSLLHADSEVTFSMVMEDGQGTGGNRLTVSGSAMQLTNVTGPQDDEGLAAWTIPFQVNNDWVTNPMGDTELTYVWSVTP